MFRAFSCQSFWLTGIITAVFNLSICRFNSMYIAEEETLNNY